MGTFKITRKTQTRSFSALGNTAQDRPVFIDAICDLVGFQNAIKRCHWSSPEMSNHTYLDTLWDETQEFTDTLVESTMGLFGQLIQIDEIKPTWIEVENSQDLINKFNEKMIAFHEEIPDDVYFSGVISLLEDFLQYLNQARYMLSITKDNEDPGIPNSGGM